MPTNYNGVLFTDEAELLSAISDLSPEQQTYILNDFHNRPHVNVQTLIESAVISAREFGMHLMVTFAAENILLGITQEGKTGEVLTKMAGVMPALQAGSLYEAITQLKAIPPEQYDSKFVTAARLLSAVNKIEAYLEIPLSESL